MSWPDALPDEGARQYAARMTFDGLMPLEVIKAIRALFGLDVDEARGMVVTEYERSIFFDALSRRNVSAAGARRLYKQVYGASRGEADDAVVASGMWPGETN